MDSMILDRRGQPFKRGDLTREIAAPSLTGVRSVWTESLAAGLTPSRLAALLQTAAQGQARDYLTLAEEMEERDPHYSAVLGVRKRAVSGLPVHVEAASEETGDVKLADAVRDLVRKPEFGYLVDDALDALGKGYAVCEIIWTRGAQWWPAAYKHRDPRFFEYDQTLAHLGLLDDEAPGRALPLAPYKFVVHAPRLKSGVALRGGLARLVAFAWICKAYTLKDWIAFAEVFGMPLRLGRYGANATEDDVAVLRNAVANIGSDAAAVLPESMKIEFEQVASATGGHELFQRLAEWIDGQVSKAVLGQTMTTDAQAAGLGSNQANVHNEVRADILISDARQLSDTLNRDLVRPFIDLNWGAQKQYPRIELQVVEPEDLASLVTALEKLVPLGLKVGEATIRDKFGLPDPGDDEELLGPAGPTAGKPALNPAQNRLQRALNRAAAPADEIDALAEDGADEWQEQLAPIIDPIERLAAGAADAEEFRARLPELLGAMDASELIARLAAHTFRARGLGDATDAIGG